MHLKPWRSTPTPWSLKCPKALAGGVLVDGGWLMERKCEEKSCWYQNCKKIVKLPTFFWRSLKVKWRNQQWFWSFFSAVFLRVRVAGSIKKIMLTTPMNAPLTSIDTTSTFQSSERASASESQFGVIKLHRHCWKNLSTSRSCTILSCSSLGATTNQ